MAEERQRLILTLTDADIEMAGYDPADVSEEQFDRIAYCLGKACDDLLATEIQEELG